MVGIKKKHVPGNQCCGATGDCFDYFDTFTTLDDWSQESGTWSASSGFATTTDSNGQLIYTPATEPFGDNWSATIPSQSDATHTKIKQQIIFWWEDTSNYWAAEIINEKPFPTFVTRYYTIRLLQYVAGTENELATDTVTDNYAFTVGSCQLYVCYRDGTVRVFGNDINSQPSMWLEYTTSQGTGSWGVGSADLTGGWETLISSWALWINTTGTYDANCGLCYDNPA